MASTSKVVAVCGLEESEISSLAKSLTIEEHADTVGLNVTEGFWKTVPNIQQVVQYQGFNPKLVAKAFIHKAVKKDELGHMKAYKLNGFEFKLYEKCDPATDLIFLITLFLERGNNVSKMVGKSDKDTSALINAKCSSI